MDNTQVVLKYLYDIRECIERVDVFFNGRPKEFESFKSDILLRQAVERNIEIMGEAMNKILKLNPEIAITNSRKIVDARNYIIHAYDSLSPDILWSIIIKHLPLLKVEVDVLLKEHQG